MQYDWRKCFLAILRKASVYREKGSNLQEDIQSCEAMLYNKLLYVLGYLFLRSCLWTGTGRMLSVLPILAFYGKYSQRVKQGEV